MAGIIKAQGIESLKAIKALLDMYNVPFVLTDGLVLGYARHKDMMEWDTNDIDIGVFKSIPIWEQQSIMNAIRGNKFYDYRNVSFFSIQSKEVSLRTGFKGFKLHNGMMISIWFFKQKGQYFDSIAFTNRLIKRELAKWFISPQPVELFGDTFLMPSDVDDYLDNHYGKEWRTEIIKTKDWKEELKEHPEKYPFPVYMKGKICLVPQRQR